MQILLNFLQAFSIIVASGTAVWGIRQWRREAVGRRQIEVAERVLAGVSEAADFVDAALLPGTIGHEGGSRQQSADETPDDKKYRDHNYVVIERLNKGADLFAGLRALQYQAGAVLGERARGSVKDVLDVRDKLIHEAQMLLTVDHQPFGDRGQTRAAFAQREWTANRDEFIATIANARKAAEDACRPYLSLKWP